MSLSVYSEDLKTSEIAAKVAPLPAASGDAYTEIPGFKPTNIIKQEQGYFPAILLLGIAVGFGTLSLIWR